MNDGRIPERQMLQRQAVQQISCQACQHEVPLSEAVVPEGVDYMMYFCGLDCYAAWNARALAQGNPDL